MAQALRQKGYKVTLTRTDDSFLKLEERTKIAEQHKPDLFLSLHINAAPHHKNVSGIETFCLTEGLFAHKHGEDPRHPHTTAYTYHGVRKKLHDAGCKAADDIQGALVEQARKSQPKLVDRGVRSRVAQVLLGVHVPAVLVELGFLSNEKEEQLLQTNAYQKRLVQGLVKGIDSFVKNGSIKLSKAAL